MEHFISSNLIEDFKAYLIDHDRSDNTIKAYARDMNDFATWFEQKNGIPMAHSELTSIDVRLYRQFLQHDRKAAPATINRRLAAIKVFAAAAVKQGFIPDNHIGEIRGVEEPRSCPKWLDKKAQMALLREAERDMLSARTDPKRLITTRNKAIVMLMLHAGLRVSEVTGIDRIDLSVGERRGFVKVRAGKGNKARRVPLNPAARNILSAWLKLNGDPGGKVFPGRETGTALDESVVWRMVARLGQRAGIGKISPHTLRHTFAKNLIDAGVSLEKVAMLLGHARLETTLIYTVPGELDLEAAVNRLD